MATNLFDSYQTDGSANQVHLSLSVGFAQLGSTAVTIGTIALIVTPPADANGNYKGDFTIPLGTNAALAGQTLQIETDVDILMAPAESSVQIQLTGGSADQEYDLDNPAAGVSVGDEIDFTAVINFK